MEIIFEEDLSNIDPKYREAFKLTVEHVETVQKAIRIFCNELHQRGVQHDRSKFSQEELPLFAEYTPKLRSCTYGSDQYKEYLQGLKPALDHHYATNSHHPEYFENGIDGMNLLDLVEMFCDWWAAVQRHADGDLNRSIEINTERFNLSPQLVSIFKNSVKLFENG